MRRAMPACLSLALYVLVAASAPALAQKEDAEKPETKKVTLARLTLKGAYPESAGSPGLFGELTTTLSGLIDRLDKAANDSEIDALVLRIDNPELGAGKVHELREAIRRYRESGKKAYAVLGGATSQEYLVAAACDEVVMAPAGSLIVTGVRAEFTFLKGLLDKLGIKADFVQMGDYKGAAEPLTRNSLSDASREQWQAILDDTYGALIETIAADRGLGEARVKELVDEGLFTADRAKQVGLIDRVAYEDEVQASLKKALGADEVALKDKYGEKEVDTDFSGLSGFMKMMELLTGASPKSRASGKPKIAVIYASGPIVDAAENGMLFSSRSITAKETNKALRKAADDENVKAIVLRVNSPGGSALASDLIWREMVRIEKPIVASMGDVAASGGYYISMGADKIFAEPGTLTGSIGVIGGKLAVQGLLDKAGVETEVLSRGKNSGILSANRGFNESERKVWTRMLRETYQQFTTKAAQGRGMQHDKLLELAGGRVWTGRMAVENGLVDELGTLDDAIAAAKKLAGLDADADVELMELPEAKTFFAELFGVSAVTAGLRAEAPELSAALGRVQLYRRLLREPALFVMPYQVRLR